MLASCLLNGHIMIYHGCLLFATYTICYYKGCLLFAIYTICYSMAVCFLPALEKGIKTEGKAKVVTAVWGTYWNAALLYNHLAARMIRTTVFVRTIILVGWWFGMVWNGWSMIIHFFKASISPSSLYSIHHFLQIILVCSAASNWMNSVSQTAATTFVFCSVCYVFFLCCFYVCHLIPDYFPVVWSLLDWITLVSAVWLFFTD